MDVSATVDAPTTEKARTTFLDYLERGGKIRRRDRQAWRKNMVAERLRDGNEVFSDVRLDYDYVAPPQEVYYEPRRSVPVDVGYEQDFYEEEPFEKSIPVQEERYISPLERAAWGRL